MSLFKLELQITTWQSMAISLYNDKIKHFTKDGT